MGNRWSIRDWWWFAFYDYFQEIWIDSWEQKENFKKLKEISDLGVYDVLYYDWLCIVSLLPTQIKSDEKMRLHNSNDMAIQWKDWYGQYYIHWVNFSPEDFEKWKNITAKELITRPNQDQKRAMMMEYGNNKLIKELKAEKVNEDTDDSGYVMTLYKIVDDKDPDWMMMFYEAIDPSKNEKVVLRVPPTMQTAYEAKMWTFPTMWDMYQQLQSKVSFEIEA